jgi:hypothetical protein
MTKTIPANQLWFINTLVTVRVSISDGQDGISVLEHRARPMAFHRLCIFIARRMKSSTCWRASFA